MATLKNRPRYFPYGNSRNLFTLSNGILLPTVNMNNVPGVGWGFTPLLVLVAPCLPNYKLHPSLTTWSSFLFLGKD
ncbi:hypothetical protein H5410_009326 [Solanum commersonii]|uniref:Uncharacterized protein n=1 Tax=Solanum commersonii TaxID=4109 RepID=A0A9J6AIE2_SOLCO|nr:hypothetical protein H5410_009326 [Solanum commersonii]